MRGKKGAGEETLQRQFLPGGGTETALEAQESIWSLMKLEACMEWSKSPRWYLSSAMLFVISPITTCRACSCPKEIFDKVTLAAVGRAGIYNLDWSGPGRPAVQKLQTLGQLHNKFRIS